ncbi:hypothetical protein [Brevundimonas sp.]|uniref:hypothetical protein n=1 Tax=Brevundimonas sp. TaxID=1871086 RepID=UPI002D6310DA|nr:hypothetical protein [Brevundimonas sp.]HYC97624.1 hypothetical protein [Brevundimonas sp.]
MTVTYPHDRPLPQDSHLEGPREEPFIPVYARTGRSARGRKGGIKTWMILAPIGVLVLGGAAAALMMGDRGEVAPAPLAEPAATAPVLPAQPVTAEAAPVEVAPVVEATPAPAPVVRRTAPASARRPVAPARTSAAAPAPAARVVAPAQPVGPQPYTATLNTTPAPAPAQAPVIVIQPVN